MQTDLLHNIFSFWNIFATDKKPCLSREAVPSLWAGKNEDRNLWPDRRASSEGDHYSNYRGESWSSGKTVKNGVRTKRQIVSKTTGMQAATTSLDAFTPLYW